MNNKDIKLAFLKNKNKISDIYFTKKEKETIEEKKKRIYILLLDAFYYGKLGMYMDILKKIKNKDLDILKKIDDVYIKVEKYIKIFIK